MKKTWYFAMMLLDSTIEGCDEEHLLEISLRAFYAASPEEARNLAAQLMEQYSHSFMNPYEQTVTHRFVDVLEIQACAMSEVCDGTEIFRKTFPLEFPAKRRAPPPFVSRELPRLLPAGAAHSVAPRHSDSPAPTKDPSCVCSALIAFEIVDKSSMQVSAITKSIRIFFASDHDEARDKARQFIIEWQVNQDNPESPGPWIRPLRLIDVYDLGGASLRCREEVFSFLYYPSNDQWGANPFSPSLRVLPSWEEFDYDMPDILPVDQEWDAAPD
jgi:hypothetical protein